MGYREAKPFSSGTEYNIFLYNWCEKCKHCKLRDDGFPAFPEQGGCPVLDAMENARFNIDEFPKKEIVEEIDDDGDVVCFHVCKRFESIYQLERSAE